MADSPADKMTCATCAPTGLCGGKGKATLKDGAWGNNPINVQILGVCSALAVTSKLENALVMSVALTFVCVGSNLFVSLLRGLIPRKIRMITEVAIIATFVILFDQLLKAYYWPMSRQLGPYVGLIITNCIIMGRAEAFALQNPPILSIVDGLGNGIGYGVVLGVIGAVRELLGFGTLLGYRLIPKAWYVVQSADGTARGWYENNQLMILAPGAFIALGFLIALFNGLSGANEEDDKK